MRYFLLNYKKKKLVRILLQKYCIVNEKFAQSTLTAIRDANDKLNAEDKQDVFPLVWIHDYQLLVAATLIRNVSKITRDDIAGEIDINRNLINEDP